MWFKYFHVAATRCCRFTFSCADFLDMKFVLGSDETWLTVVSSLMTPSSVSSSCLLPLITVVGEQQLLTLKRGVYGWCFPSVRLLPAVWIGCAWRSQAQRRPPARSVPLHFKSISSSIWPTCIKWLMLCVIEKRSAAGSPASLWHTQRLRLPVAMVKPVLTGSSP